MNSSNHVAETKALISFAVTASLFWHMQKNLLFHDGTPLIFLKFEYSPTCLKQAAKGNTKIACLRHWCLLIEVSCTQNVKL